MVLVPHPVFIFRIIRTLFLFVCCIFTMCLLHDKSKKSVRFEYDERNPWSGQVHEVRDKSASQLSSLDWFKKTGDSNSSLHLSPSFSVKFNSTVPSNIAEPKIAIPITHHQKTFQDVLPLWIRITDDLYAYSAFWDARQNLLTGPVVRIISILRYQKELLHDVTYGWSHDIRKDALKYSCYLWYRGQNAEKGELSAFIYEEGIKVFVGTYFLCSPQESTNNSSNTKFGEIRVPYAVSLVPDGTNSTVHKLIYLSQNKKSGQRSDQQSGVCVRALFGPYSDLAAITLFISYYNTVLNISHFYFYDFAISKTVREFLMLLMADSGVIIHLLPWNIPFSELEMIWDLGSLTSTNDCIYRASGKLSHVAVVDLDEFIVPRATAISLKALYSDVIKHKHGQEGDAVLILNVFFCSEFKENNKTTKTGDFNIFRATFREARLWPSKSRSKVIVVPETVVSIGHHMVHNFLKADLKNQASPKMLSVLHHYRHCDDLRTGIHATGSKVLEHKPVRDASILKYKNDVLSSGIISQYLSFIRKTL